LMILVTVSRLHALFSRSLEYKTALRQLLLYYTNCLAAIRKLFRWRVSCFCLQSILYQLFCNIVGLVSFIVILHCVA
jgi:hypothetical protein